MLSSAGCWTYTFQWWVLIFSPPHTQQHNGTRRMEEPNLIASESLAFLIQEEVVGVGKAGLKVRLASDMDKDFLERLNKFCSPDAPLLSRFLK